MYQFSCLAIVRNEEPYLSEWIEYHRLQGVEHFYLYENNSTDDTYKVLQRYAEQGIVTLVSWKSNPGQMPAYAHYLKMFGANTNWCAVLDVDEFLYTPYPGRWANTYAYLKAVDSWREQAFTNKLYAPFKDVAGIAIPWIFFGSNGQEAKQNGLVIERFTKRSKSLDKHVKSIIKPKYITSVGKNPHVFYSKQRIVDERGRDLPVEYATDAGCAGDILRIAHFHTKSHAEYVKRKRDNPDPGHGRFATNIEERFKAHDTNEVLDLNLFNYAERVKRNVLY